MKKAIAIVILMVACAGCLEAENRHAFYLEPDGSATWVVMEEDVRPGPEYLSRARYGQTEIAGALRGLGASWVRTTVVRDAPPYTVMTEARFDSAAQMLESFLRSIDFEAEAELRFEAGRTTLSFRFWETDEEEGGNADGPAGSLVEPEEQYRFVLTEGKFVEATGFRLRAEDTVAELLDLDEVEKATEPEGVFFSLTWSEAR